MVSPNPKGYIEVYPLGHLRIRITRPIWLVVSTKLECVNNFAQVLKPSWGKSSVKAMISNNFISCDLLPH